MNKRVISKIKKAINYEGLPEQKRMIKSFIKGYQEIPHNKKQEYLNMLISTFNK